MTVAEGKFPEGGGLIFCGIESVIPAYLFRFRRPVHEAGYHTAAVPACTTATNKAIIIIHDIAPAVKCILLM